MVDIIVEDIFSMCQNKYPVKIGKRLNPYTGHEYDIYEYVPCRKCEECISIRKSQWCFRALVETDHSKYADFVTLTYDNDHLPADHSVSVRDLQLFSNVYGKTFIYGIQDSTPSPIS